MNSTCVDDSYIRDRITKLRIEKNVSERQMSADLNKSSGYIQNISSGKSLPKMHEFLSICEYFNITPAEFFNEKLDSTRKQRELMSALEGLEEDDMELLLGLIDAIQREK